MRFTVASIHPSQTAKSSALEFEIVHRKLLILGRAVEPFDVIVQPFDPLQDIVYRTPEPLTPDRLSDEIAIHVPIAISSSIESQPIAVSLGDFVHIQTRDPAFLTIPLLAALKKILWANETVNSAILHAENGSIAFVRNAGNAFFGGATLHSLREFIELAPEERNRIFPDIHAANILISGPDAAYVAELTFDAFSNVRRIRISDLEPLCGFSSEARILVQNSPHFYTLTIGAAAVYSEIFTSIP